jgi:riboflavin kinase / FMN adenylyltransferase
VQPFTREFAAIPARDFVREYFVNRLQAREVVVGHDYRFGYRREGSIALLKEMGQSLGFSVQVVWAVEVDDAVVSSSLIRAMLKLGNVREANRLLGRTYGVAGRVVAGKGRGGKLLGVPTANLVPENDLLPASGIYAVWVAKDHERLPGVANIGTCPTFDNQDLSLEVHLIDFNETFTGRSWRWSLWPVCGRSGVFPPLTSWPPRSGPTSLRAGRRWGWPGASEQ